MLDLLIHWILDHATSLALLLFVVYLITDLHVRILRLRLQVMSRQVPRSQRDFVSTIDTTQPSTILN